MASSPSQPLAQWQLDELLGQIRVPGPVKVAGVLLLFDGLLVAVLALQNLVIFHWTGFYLVFPFVLLAASLAAMFVGARLVRARSWAMTAALVAGGALLLLNGLWSVLMLLSGVLTALCILTIPLGLTALVFLAVAVRPFTQVATARRLLREAGHDVDL